MGRPKDINSYTYFYVFVCFYCVLVVYCIFYFCAASYGVIMKEIYSVAQKARPAHIFAFIFETS